MSICRNNDKAILLDVDGVLSEWVIACCELMEKDYTELLGNWPAGTFYIENVLDMDTKEYGPSMAKTPTKWCWTRSLTTSDAYAAEPSCPA